MGHLAKNQLLISSGLDYTQMTIDLLTEGNLAEIIKNRNASIAIKPNLVSASPASFGATTHPEVVAGILEYLQSHGFHSLTVMEGSWVGDKTMECFEICGYQDLCRHYQVPFVDLQKDPYIKTDCAGMPINICRSALASDFLINVPVVKGHCQTKVTCALKNMKGLLPNAEKRRFHSLGLHKPIACLNAGIHQDFIVADNICGDLDFEDGGNPVEMNRIIIGRDPVLMDAYICQMLHYEVDEVPYIRLAEKLGVGTADLKQADIRTLDKKELEDVPLSRKVVEAADAVWEVESCSACYGYLLPALHRLGDELEKDGKDRNSISSLLGSRLCIGQGWRGKTGQIGIGSCTRGFARYLDGCPPTETQIYEFLLTILRESSGN